MELTYSPLPPKVPTDRPALRPATAALDGGLVPNSVTGAIQPDISMSVNNIFTPGSAGFSAEGADLADLPFLYARWTNPTTRALEARLAALERQRIMDELAAELGASQNMLLWIINGYTLALAALLMPIGAIGDRWGRKPILLAGLAMMVAMPLLAASAWLPIIGDPLCALAGWLELPFWRCLLWMALGKLLRYMFITQILLEVPDSVWHRLLTLW